MLVAEDGLRGFAMAGGAVTFLPRIFMNRKPWRIDPQLDEVANPDVLFQNGVRNQKVLRVFGIHGHAVHQLITVGQVLGMEAMFEFHAHIPQTPGFCVARLGSLAAMVLTSHGLVFVLI
jgi:hypothetical protein